jgi:lysozyme
MKNIIHSITFVAIVAAFVAHEIPPVEIAVAPEAILVKPKKHYNSWEQELVNQVKYFESFKPSPYRCPAGVLTVGYGHTGKFASDSVTKQRAEYLLKKELEECRAIVRRNVKVPLTEYQTCALVSFTYNCGEKNLRSLINGKARLNSGNYKSVSKLMPLYSKAKGKTLNGLVKRRALESNMWLGKI